MRKIAFVLALAAVACRPIDTEPDILVEEGGYEDGGDYGYYDSEGDIEMEVEPTVYRATEPVLTDLINTKLEVSFDWTKAQLIGKETLTAKPHFYATDSLILDAKGMEIKSVTLGGKALAYTYDGDFLRIQLNKKYTNKENYSLVIDYIAKPNERTTGGSDAITSDKGLYFINNDGKTPGKMPQIWTQGETEASSVWFPTIDQPNIKTKQEIYMTVDAKYATLSNGKLISSTKNANGTRTDYWKQELPHAPYLAMMAVGEFKVVKDTYKRPDGSTMEVNYYVEPEWEQNAKAIFGETPKMISYFSKLLGVEYPWDKYSQIVVRDYVSGAMENTGAVVFGDYVYKSNRELLDGNDNSTIAHELFHHWFGDLVTCESWSNLTLNESFANYSQYLWDEYRHGLDEADYQAEQEANGYFASGAGNGYHNLVWFDYEDKEDMFDGHSYNKGGRILHMLRNYVGDEAFFAGLNLYLKSNSFKSAEYNQLRLAMEEVTGEDLNWFFNEWYLDKGHMDLDVNYSIEEENILHLSVDQTFSTAEQYFKMPVNVTIFDDRGTTTQRIWIQDQYNTTVDLPTSGTVTGVIFDSQSMLLGDIREVKNNDWWITQYYKGTRYAHRRDALMYGTDEMTDASNKMIVDALSDKFWDVRLKAIGKTVMLSGDAKTVVNEKLKTIAANDSVPAVRMAAINRLVTVLPSAEAKTLLDERMSSDQAYSVVIGCLSALSKLDADYAMKKAQSFENEPSSRMMSGIAGLYARSTDPGKIAYYEKIFSGNKLQGYERVTALGAFTYFMSQQEPVQHRKALAVFENEIKIGGYYSQMFMPRYFEYIIAALNDKVDGMKQKLEDAKTAGNSNQQAIIQGNITEAEAILAEYQRLNESVAPVEFGE